MNGTSSPASMRSNASVSRMPVWATLSATETPSTTIGIIATRVHSSSGSRTPSSFTETTRRTPKMLRTATADVARIAPDAVENDAATMPDRTRTVRPDGA